MSFAVARLLGYSDQLSAEVRDAVRAAYAAPAADRPALLQTAAKIVHANTGVGCSDVLELFGLERAPCHP